VSATPSMSANSVKQARSCEQTDLHECAGDDLVHFWLILNDVVIPRIR
jgi:hypothetical protein